MSFDLKQVSIWKHSSPTFTFFLSFDSPTLNELSWTNHSLNEYKDLNKICSVFATYVKWTESTEKDFFTWLKSLSNLKELDISYSTFSDRNVVNYFFSPEAQSLTKIHIHGNHYMLRIIPRQNMEYISCNILNMSEILFILDEFPNLKVLNAVCANGTNSCKKKLFRLFINMSTYHIFEYSF